MNKNYSVSEHLIQTKDGKIFGLLYKPDNIMNAPTIIICHGFTGTYRDNIDYAEHFVSQGYVVYIFDFRGGSIESKSDGKMTDMSVMTEVKDLNEVVNNIRSLKFVQPNRITLIGKSQGGVVSAIFAARNPNLINKLVLIYPAFVIHDDAHKLFKSLDEVPETYKVFDESSTVGKRYAQDIWNYDVYKEIGKFDKPVLIIHGSKDKIVPIFYSEKASKIYPNVTFKIIRGAGHGFGPTYTPESFQYIDSFLKKTKNFS